MEGYLVGIIFLVFMIMIDWKLNRIRKELMWLNEQVADAVKKLLKNQH